MTENIREVDLDVIYNNPYQMRHDYRDIPDLARSIAADGLEQKPKARYDADGVQLKFGHRRREAFRWLRDNWKSEGLRDRYNGYTVMPVEIEALTDEQMFRGATIENSQRADLSPIERMEEMKAWVAFGYNSKQIADLYPGMSDATVRGLLYFDNLTPEAKQALHNGEINQGTARALLSLQKVADQQDIVRTLDKIKKKEDENPETIVEEELSSLDHVVELWEDSRRDGKPRSHWRNGWLLDMKNFPNKMLPAMSVEAVGLHEAHIDHLTNPPACSACSFYTKMRGTHYCGMKICYERKTIAWRREMVRAASKNLNIPIYEESDGQYLVLQSHENKHEALFAKGHADLRLIEKSQITARGYFSQYSFKGVEDDVFMVVAIGETAKKLAAGDRHAKGTAIDRSVQRRAKLFTDKRKQIQWEFTAFAKTIFDTVPGKLANRLNDWKYLGVDFRPPEGNEPGKDASDESHNDYSRRLLAWRLIDDEMDWGEYESVTEVFEALTRLAKEWGLKAAPKSLMTMAKGFDEEINTAYPVSAATGKGKKK